MEVSPKKLYLPNGNFIAYHKHEGKENNVSVIFLCGFMSDMEGIKATALEKFCKDRGYSFIRFDYFGHGKSSKNFTDCTIGTWKQNVIDVLDNLTNGKQIIIGSSMGGWLMLLAALERPMRISALIGIASAPDFTEDLIWNQMTPAEQKELMENGIFNIKSEFSDNPYPVTKQLIEEGRGHLLLRGELETLDKRHCEESNEVSTTRQSNVNDKERWIASSHSLQSAHRNDNHLALLPYVPIRLIHGLKDTDVPSSISTRVASLLTNSDVKVSLVEDGDHRMSTPENIKLLCDTLEEIVITLANWA